MCIRVPAQKFLLMSKKKKKNSDSEKKKDSERINQWDSENLLLFYTNTSEKRRK